MAMRWDSLLVRHVARELADLLRGQRLRAVRLDGERHDLVLLFRETTVAWRLHPSRGYPLLFPAQDPSEGDLPLASRVRAVTAAPDERYLVFELLPVRGRGRNLDIVVELMGNQWNAAVTEGAEHRIRHVLHRRGGRRPFAVGECWTPVPGSDRSGLDGTDAGVDWAELAGLEPEDARRALVSRVAWTSPLNAGHILGTGQEPSGSAAARRWRELADPDRPTAPTVVDLDHGPQPYPFPLQGAEGRPFGTLLGAIGAAAAALEANGVPRPALLPTGLLRDLEAAVDRARRRATRLRAELDRLEDPDEHQATGDLLLARFREVPRGSASVDLEDFEGTFVTVELDPGLSVQDNAARYYSRAARTRRALERLPGMIADADADVSALEILLERVEDGDASEEEVRRLLPRAAPAGKPAGGAGTASLPYHSFVSSGGLEIRVGRGAKHNDALTFSHSSPGDVWLHARHAAGAHVILRWNRTGAPPARDLEEAAVLAALNSRARTSGTVPVDWTLRKYVRKPRRAAAGAVIPERVKTVFVEPDPTLPEKLTQAVEA